MVASSNAWSRLFKSVPCSVPHGNALTLPSPGEGRRVWTGLRHPDSARGKGYTPLPFSYTQACPKLIFGSPAVHRQIPLFRFVFCFLLVVSCPLSFPSQLLLLLLFLNSFFSFFLLLFLLLLAAEPEHLERSNNAGKLVGSPASVTSSTHSFSSRSGARNPLVAVQHLSFSSPAQPTPVVSTPLPMQTSPR